MKHWMLAAALICFGSQAAVASPYFRVADPDHLYKVAGAYIDPSHPGSTSYGTAVALVTHSTADGCLLPKVVCEDWSPLMVGPSYNAGRFQVNLGPAANLSPFAKAGILRAVNALTEDGDWPEFKSMLGSEPIGGPSASISFGPALNVSPFANGTIMPLSKWKGLFRVFFGAGFKFGK